MTKRTIVEWVAVTQKGKSGWIQCYKELLGSPISDIDKFMKAVKDFGGEIMLEAIVAASTRKLTGDPLNYVLGIAVAKTNELISAISEDARYKMQLDMAKQRIETQNDELEDKLERARKAHGTQ